MAAGGIEEEQGPGLGPAARRRFSLRRFFKALRRFFREPRRSIRHWLRGRSQVVQVKPADPRKVKLLLFSWGLAVGLMIIAFGLFHYLSPPGTGELLEKAGVAYDDGQYAEAIKFWDIYLKQYPSDSHAADVRVRHSLAELRAAVEEARAAGDWTPAFELTQSLMKKLPEQPGYADRQREVGEVLGLIGVGLASQAAKHPTAALVDQAGYVVGMIEMNVGESWRPTQALAEIQPLLDASKRQVKRSQDLEDKLAAIAEALRGQDALAAYAARNTLVVQHPELAEDPRLEEALGAAAALLAQAVKLVSQTVPAATSEQATGILASRALAVRTVRGAVAVGGQPGAKGGVVFAATAGVAYGLDAASGRLLWRRFISAPGTPGPASVNPQAFPPQPLGDDFAGDLLLVDPLNNELLRVAGASGRLVWRQAIGRRIVAAPVRAGNRLLVPAERGQLVVVDLATGASPGHVALPQPVNVSPTVDPQRLLVFQVADQSTLYVLAQDDWRCRQVFHLGQQRNAVVAPPVVAGNCLLVVENEGPREATLRVLSLAASQGGSPPLKSLQRIRLSGRVTTAPLVHGRQVAVLTVEGTLALFKLAAGGGGPLESVAHSELSGNEEATRYLLAGDAQWWVADTQLARYEIDAQAGRLVPRQITSRLLRFVAPPLLAGPVMYHVRERPGMPGVMVSAVDPQTDEPVWQTWLAAPLAGEPLTDAPSGSLTAVTASGGVFRFPPASLQGHAPADQPVLAVEADKLLQSLHDVTPLGGGRFVLTMGPGSRPLIVYDPEEHDKRFRSLVAPEPLAAAPLGLGSGMLLTSASGKVFLLDPQSAGLVADPFRPSAAGVTVWKWWPPQAAGRQAALLCDGDRRVYLVGVQTQPEAALVELAAVKTVAAVVAPPAVVPVPLGSGQPPTPGPHGVAFLVTGGNSVVPLSLPNLTEGQSQLLDGRPVWGPRRAGNVVLLATEKHRLYAFAPVGVSAAGRSGLLAPAPGEGGQPAPAAALPGTAEPPAKAAAGADSGAAAKPALARLLWHVDLPRGFPVGAPLASEGFLYLTMQGGTVWRVAAETGQEAGKTESGCPLGTGPVLIDGRLFVATVDGCLLEIKRP
jgi:outer membrane protein assembly factor BamB